MTTRLVVETSDLSAASQAIYHRVADPVLDAAQSLLGVLDGTGGMAGSDDGARAWAHAYDPASTATLHATERCLNACYRLSAMFAQTARNYESAEAHSTAGERRTLAGLVGRLPDPTHVGLPAAPSAVAVSPGDLLPGWTVVASLVGYLCPDGHQDLLHAAADAWSASAAGIAGHAADAAYGSAQAQVDSIPEAEDMSTVCLAMWHHLDDLAHAHRTLGRACRDLAHHLDQVRSSILHELVSLAEWTGGIELFGAIFGAMTAGTAELPAQFVESARVADAVRMIVMEIRLYISLAREAVAALPAVQRASEVIADALESLQSSRLVVAGMDAVPGFGGILRASASLDRVGVADGRLAMEAGDAGPLLSAGKFRWPKSFDAPRVYRDRHGFLTNGKYRVLSSGMSRHTVGATGEKSQFLMHVNADEAVLDAAAYADKYGLWVDNKARIYVQNGPVGVHARSGRLTHWIYVYRTASDSVHGTPGAP